MLVFDLILGLVFVSIIIVVMLVGIGHSHHLQQRLHAEAEDWRTRQILPAGGLDRRRISRHEIDEAQRRVVRARRLNKPDQVASPAI
jgi:hypothetical protein